MIKVKALKDDSSHWYLVPNELCDEFHKLSNRLCSEDDSDEYYEAENEFITKFGQYMTGGDLNNVQLFIEEK